MLGHAHNVCALDISPRGDFVVSGSWDGTGRIWDVGKWECSAILEGHDGSVWAVLAYDFDMVITGYLSPPLLFGDSKPDCQCRVRR